jgi:hypothetical protein
MTTNTIVVRWNMPKIDYDKLATEAGRDWRERWREGREVGWGKE